MFNSIYNHNKQITEEVNSKSSINPYSKTFPTKSPGHKHCSLVEKSIINANFICWYPHSNSSCWFVFMKSEMDLTGKKCRRNSQRKRKCRVHISQWLSFIANVFLHKYSISKSISLLRSWFIFEIFYFVNKVTEENHLYSTRTGPRQNISRMKRENRWMTAMLA